VIGHPSVGLQLKQFEVRGRNEFQLGPLTATISPGNFVGLLGPAQSGKSLFLASLCGLVPHGGKKEFLSPNPSDDVNAQLIFQEGGLLEELTVRANLGLAQNAFGTVKLQIQDDLLERLGIAQAASLLPRELSGGMRKRVLLARALLCEPQILLIDNVAAGLDPNNAKKLLDLVLDLKQELGFTLLWVTHEPGPMLTHLDQVMIFQDGQLAFMGHQDDIPQNERFHSYLQA
tara:strand:+ start:66 stop:758 length:693 start_codon:yes stop_codon:yes gene_type:complete